MSDFAEFLRGLAKDSVAYTAESIFAEEPVSLSVFVQDKQYLANPPLSPVQYDAVRHIERVYYNGVFRQEDGSLLYKPERDTYRLLAEQFEADKKADTLHVGAVSAWRDEPYWSQPIRMINFATLQWGKGCISGKTDIYDSRTGCWRPVEQVSELTVQGVDAVNIDGSTEHLPEAPALVRGCASIPAPTDGSPFNRGHGRCVRVATATGGHVDVYVGHLFVAWRDADMPYKNRYQLAKPVWRRAGDLQAGDRIAILSKLDCLEPVRQDPREVELVGYWIGDGSMPVKTSAQWGFYVDAGAGELRARYTELVESYPGITAKHEKMTSGTIRIRATGWSRGRYAKSPLIEVIRRWGLYGSRAWDKRVPEAFFSLPDDQLALFLSALWDTDGSVYFAATGAPRVEYCTVSEGLARDIQRLLYRFGVVSRLTSSIKNYVYKGERRQGRRAWRVEVQADHYVKRLLLVLRLHGEKEQRRSRALEWVCAKPQQVLDGDVYWDRVVSVEEIGDHDYWDMHVPTAGTYVAGSMPFLSSNSGKDHICRVASMRIAYLLMCLQSPQEYFSMPTQDTIHLLNVAWNSQQAQQAFFLPITRAVKKGWFANRCIPRQNIISFDMNIEAVSGHSDAESQEGLNLILGIADEIDAFRSRKEMSARRGATSREPTKSAEGILNMMRSSSVTRFPQTFKQVRISYPRYLGSMIQLLTKDAKDNLKERGKDSRHYVSGPLATWQVNPNVPGKEYFAEEYADDPVMARSKYECRPARAVNPYFRNQIAIDSCFEPRAKMPLTISYEVDHTSGAPIWVARYHFASDFQPIRGAVYAMHGDLAVKGDRAGIAMAHCARYTEHPVSVSDDDGAIYQVNESRPNIKVDFVVSFTSDASTTPPREIQIRWARQLCLELIKRGFNIRLFTFDTFQCLSGDTEIPLLDGTSRKLRELAGATPFWVYSTTNGRVVPGLCTKAWRTGHREDMVEVELDNGALLRATSDHRFMLRDGTYRRADRLVPGDSLMPLYRRRNYKVVVVRPAPPEDVYDLQVEDHHNFATAAGVFVHNSVDSMQILKAKGIESKKVSTDTSDEVYRNLRDLMYDGRVTIPRPIQTPEQPSFLLRDELFSLTRLSNGRIDHPADGSKDECDALACAVKGAVELGGAEDPTGERTHFAPPEVTVGSIFTLPTGATYRGVFERPNLDELSPLL